MSIYDGMKPSQVVQSFLDWLADVKEDQEHNWNIVTKEDGDRLTDLIHEVEFSDGEEKLLEVAKRFQESRLERRAAKDRAKALKPVKDYADDATCKAHIKRLNRLVKDLQQVEEFLGSDRIYKPRATAEETVSYVEAIEGIDMANYVAVGEVMNAEYAEDPE